MSVDILPAPFFLPSVAAYSQRYRTNFVCVFRWLKTEMGNSAAKLLGQDEAEIEIEESVQGVIAVIDRAERDRERYSGRFLSYTGSEYPW